MCVCVPTSLPPPPMPSTLEPSGFLTSNSDLDVYSSRQSPGWRGVARPLTHLVIPDRLQGFIEVHGRVFFTEASLK